MMLILYIAVDFYDHVCLMNLLRTMKMSAKLRK